MKECPECGHVFEKLDKNKPWVPFEFNEQNFYPFKLVLKKMIIYMRFNDLSVIDDDEMVLALKNSKAGIPIPFDSTAKFETFRLGINISLCSILEYFHLMKIAPKNSVRLKDTNIFSKYEKARHFSAHIIHDINREIKVSKELRNLNIKSTFSEIVNELLIFVRDGIDKYLDMGKLTVNELRNTKESKELLEFVNELREREGRKLIVY